MLHNESPATGSSVDYYNFNCWDKNNWLTYEGEFNNDKKDGFGTLYFLNGDKFSGCFKGDAVEGFGSFYDANRQQHMNGIWVNNVYQK